MARRRTSKRREVLAFFVEISGRGEYKHLNLRIRKMQVVSAESELGDCIANYPENTDHYVNKARKVYEATGAYEYLTTSWSNDEINIRWQSGKDSNFMEWYGPQLECALGENALEMLKRVHKLTGGSFHFSLDPRHVVKGLIENGKAVAYKYVTQANEHVIDTSFKIAERIPSPPAVVVEPEPVRMIDTNLAVEPGTALAITHKAE